MVEYAAEGPTVAHKPSSGVTQRLPGDGKASQHDHIGILTDGM